MVGVVAVVGSNWFDGLCVCGFVDGLCLCVCVFVVVGLWLKWLVLLGFRWAFFVFFVFFNMGFCSGGILVSNG